MFEIVKHATALCLQNRENLAICVSSYSIQATAFGKFTPGTIWQRRNQLTYWRKSPKNTVTLSKVKIESLSLTITLFLIF
jgi:hypothetical protein